MNNLLYFFIPKWKLKHFLFWSCEECFIAADGLSWFLTNVLSLHIMSLCDLNEISGINLCRSMLTTIWLPLWKRVQTLFISATSIWIQMVASLCKKQSLGACMKLHVDCEKYVVWIKEDIVTYQMGIMGNTSLFKKWSKMCLFSWFWQSLWNIMHQVIKILYNRKNFTTG